MIKLGSSVLAAVLTVNVPPIILQFQLIADRLAKMEKPEALLGNDMPRNFQKVQETSDVARGRCLAMSACVSHGEMIVSDALLVFSGLCVIRVTCLILQLSEQCQLA